MPPALTAAAVVVFVGAAVFAQVPRDASHEGAPGAVAASQASPSTEAGVYTVAQARRGATLVEPCAACHGAELDGALAPALVGPDFLQRWSGRPLADLFDLVLLNARAGPSAGGADAPPLFERAADITAFLLLQNGMPSGREPLAHDVERLRHTRIDPRWPR